MLETVWAAAYLHDLGKLSVPLRVLGKETALDDDEMEEVRLHPSVGASILERIPSLRHLSTGARYHHERWDGRGYPEGLKGDHIPLLAQVLAVSDSYDAMTSNRAYRPSRDHEVAMDEIARGTGVQFGPRAAAAFCAFSNAATAFFEYTAASIVAPGWSLRKAPKASTALPASPRLASQTPR